MFRFFAPKRPVVATVVPVGTVVPFTPVFALEVAPDVVPQLTTPTLNTTAAIAVPTRCALVEEILLIN